ncbi:protein of unknown function [Candidatus Filomicrobium marinum]|uniref:Uncharacterized protein n=1 Tax=Candidatus Filomicrobium marinum TaxID=1608628 RepID=A0A0D6JCE8_9HYPH|nr:protein of unknown function [Candidatus Filomicrobium marinum]
MLTIPSGLVWDLQMARFGAMVGSNPWELPDKMTSAIRLWQQSTAQSKQSVSQMVVTKSLSQA